MYRWIAFVALVAMPAPGFASLDASEVQQFFDAAFEVQRQEHELAGAVVAALQAQGLEGVPVSGQDGDHAALNRVARGLQAVSVWKDVAVAVAGMMGVLR